MRLSSTRLTGAVKSGELDKHGRTIEGKTPATWTQSYVDLTVNGAGVPSTALVPTQPTADVDDDAMDEDAAPVASTSAAVAESSAKPKKRKSVPEGEAPETPEQRAARKEAKRAAKAAKAAAGDGAEPTSEAPVAAAADGAEPPRKKKKRASEAAA